jgi:hypothetical protein
MIEGSVRAHNLIRVQILKIRRFRRQVLVQVTVGEDVRPAKWLRQNDSILQSLYFKVS